MSIGNALYTGMASVVGAINTAKKGSQLVGQSTLRMLDMRTKKPSWSAGKNNKLIWNWQHKSWMSASLPVCVFVCLYGAHVYKIRIKSTATNFQVETWKRECGVSADCVGWRGPLECRRIVLLTHVWDHKFYSFANKFCNPKKRNEK